jgi:microcystin-dependent protein
MSSPFIGEISVVAFNFPPKGWAFCNGQLLPISQNQALFSLLGTTFGGDGRTTFALPDLRGRTGVHLGNGFNLGQAFGEENVTLNISEMPAHSHVPACSSAAGTVQGATGNVWAKTGAAGHNVYAGSADSTMFSTLIQPSGGGQPHQNLQPLLVLNYIIALVGVFPSRN